jgi:hypothetical protein
MLATGQKELKRLSTKPLNIPAKPSRSAASAMAPAFFVSTTETTMTVGVIFKDVCDFRGSIAMRYYFDVENHPDHRDPLGKDCSTQAEAREHARKVAKQLATKELTGSLDETSVVVADEGGREVYRLPLKDVDERP